MAHIINNPHALYYNGELIGIITNSDPYGDIHSLVESLSPDEGLAEARPMHPDGIAEAIKALPETIPTGVELVEQLNLYEVCYTTGPEGVKLEACPEDDSLFDSEGFVVDPNFNAFLNVIDSFRTYLDDDPRDRRAGKVCWVEFNGDKAWYDENGDCCWIG